MQEKNDRELIQDMIFLYAYLLDMGRAEEIPDRVFTEDVILHHGTANDQVGREAIRRGFASAPSILEATAHQISNVMIEVDGNRATSLARVTGWHWLKGSPAAGTERAAEFVQLAAYHDHWRRTPTGWQIAERTTYVFGPTHSGVALGSLPPWPNEFARHCEGGALWPEAVAHSRSVPGAAEPSTGSEESK
jgi:hypothetical protein